jgi:lysophospholipase L1-like esterase
VMVTALGVNDVVSQVSPHAWVTGLQALDKLARERAGSRYTLHSAVPPMHSFPLLPQPLRWLLGAHAMRLNRALGRQLLGQAQRGMQALPANLHGAAAARLMARDGFHPGPAGYAVWAAELADRIAREWARLG